MNSKSFQEKDSRGITSFKSFIRFIKVLVFLAVMESLVYLVIKVTAQNTTMHHLGNITFYIVGMFTVFAVIGGPIVNVKKTTILKMLEAQFHSKALIDHCSKVI